MMSSIFTSVAATLDASDNNIPEIAARDLIPGILTTVYWVAGASAVIVIVIAGIFYAISQGDAAKIKRAKEAILYALVGLVVVMVAFVITNFIAGRFG